MLDSHTNRQRMAHLQLHQYTVFHCSASYLPLSDGVLLLLLALSLAVTMGIKWKAFCLIWKALNISLLVQHLDQWSPTLDGTHQSNWWLMLYICVYIYTVTIMGLKDHCLVSRYIHWLMLHVMNDYYMTKCAELKDCKMGGFVNQKK